MATIRKRGAKWRAQIRRVGVRPISHSHAHKEAAMCLNPLALMWLNPLKDKCTYGSFC